MGKNLIAYYQLFSNSLGGGSSSHIITL